MSRPRYPRSDETYEVLRDHVGAVAKEYPCDDSYIYAIKNGTSNDPYPPFRHMFCAAVGGGAPVEIYLRDLQGVLARRPAGRSITEDLVDQLSKKIESDANETSEILGAIGDRQLDRAECQRILDSLDIGDKISKGIRRLTEQRLAEISSEQFEKG